MINYLSYLNVNDPVTSVLSLDEEVQNMFDVIDNAEGNGNFDTHITDDYNVEGDEDYGEDPGYADFCDDDIGTLDIVDLDAEEIADADMEVEDYGDIIDSLMDLDDGDETENEEE